MRPKGALKVLGTNTVLGIDPSSNHLAVVTMMGKGYRADNFPLGKGRFEAHKATRAYRAMSHLLESIPLPDGGDRYAFIERSIVARGGAHATVVQAYASGAIQAALGQHQFKVIFVSPAQWKKSVCGHGHSTKEVVAETLRQRWPALYRKVYLDQDIIDAAAIAIHGGIQVCGGGFMAA